MKCKKCNSTFSSPEIQFFEAVFSEYCELIANEYFKKTCPKCKFVWFEKINPKKEVKD